MALSRSSPGGCLTAEILALRAVQAQSHIHGMLGPVSASKRAVHRGLQTSGVLLRSCFGGPSMVRRGTGKTHFSHEDLTISLCTSIVTLLAYSRLVSPSLEPYMSTVSSAYTSQSAPSSKSTAFHSCDLRHAAHGMRTCCMVPVC